MSGAITILLIALLSQHSQFVLNVQHGRSPFDILEDKGAINYQEYIKLLDQYPWLTEIEKANATQKSSPTITVIYTKAMKSLSVSMSGDRTNNGYLVGYTSSRFIYIIKTRLRQGMTTEDKMHSLMPVQCI